MFAFQNSLFICFNFVTLLYEWNYGYWSYHNINYAIFFLFWNDLYCMWHEHDLHKIFNFISCPCGLLLFYVLFFFLQGKVTEKFVVNFRVKFYVENVALLRQVWGELHSCPNVVDGTMFAMVCSRCSNIGEEDLSWWFTIYVIKDVSMWSLRMMHVSGAMGCSK